MRVGCLGWVVVALRLLKDGVCVCVVVVPGEGGGTANGSRHAHTGRVELGGGSESIVMDIEEDGGRLRLLQAQVMISTSLLK